MTEASSIYIEVTFNSIFPFLWLNKAKAKIGQVKAPAF